MTKEINGFSNYTPTVASERKITTDRIKDLYGTCLLRESDFDTEGLTCDFRIGEGVMSDELSIFSVDRLNDCREELDEYIGQLSDIDQAPSFSKLSFTRTGEKWAEDSGTVDMLVRMGMASSMLFFTFPKQLWPYLPEGIPGVGKQIYDSKKGLFGNKAEEYDKIFCKK